MTSEPNKEQKNNAQKAQALFKITKKQIVSGIAKYDKAAAAIQTFNSRPFEDTKISASSSIFKRRLNSLDSTMLEENAYRALDNEELKLEKQIEDYENTIKIIDEKITVVEAVQDEEARRELLKQKYITMQKIESLKTQYIEQNLETKLSTVISDILHIPSKLKSAIISQFKRFIRSSKLLKKISPLKKIIQAKDTLEKLNKINQSVDQLVSMKMPYGEHDAKYQTLINHLQQANSLHTQIKKELNT